MTGQGFRLPDTLPVVAALEALPGVGAVLTLEGGERVTVGAEDCPTLTPPSPQDVGLLTNWRTPEASRAYRVPAALAGHMAWALGCRSLTTPTLSAVHSSPDSFTLTADQWGARGQDVLTAPRGACVRLGWPVPYAGEPLTLTVQEDGDNPARVFFFAVYHTTPEGAACLKALGLMGNRQVGAPEE